MTQIAQPTVNVNIVSAITEVPNDEQRVLFVGQMTVSGSSVDGALNTNIQDDSSWDGLFGPTSMLADMVRNARSLNKVSRFDAIGLDDEGGATAAEKTMTVVGTASEAGSFVVSVGSKQNHTVSVPVNNADDETAIALAISTAINSDLTMPFTASNTLGVVTLVADNAGTYGNEIGLEITGAIAGVASVTLAASVTGVTDPTLTSVLDVIGDIRYQTIVWPYSGTSPDQLAPLITLLDARFNSTVDVLDGVGVTTAIGTSATLETNYSSLNSQSLVIVGDSSGTSVTEYLDLPSVFEIPAVKAAELGAIRAIRRTEGASIAQFLSGEVGLDGFGSPALSGRPYFNTPFPTVPVSVVTSGYSQTEVESLIDNGISVMGNNSTLTSVIMGEVVTTYKTDAASNLDISFKFLNYVDTSSAVREYFTNNLKSRFAQTRLTEGDLVPGRPMANAQLILSTLMEFYNTLSGPEFALTQAGETARNTFISNTTVSVELSRGVVTILMGAVPLVTQLRTINATMTISFSATG